jgi:hypothetical protein
MENKRADKIGLERRWLGWMKPGFVDRKELNDLSTLKCSKRLTSD